MKPELVRVSVGIEHIEDIKADFQQAFDLAVPKSARNETKTACCSVL